MGHQSTCLCSFRNGAWSQFRLFLQYFCLPFVCLSYLVFCLFGFASYTVFSGLLDILFVNISFTSVEEENGYNKFYIYIYIYIYMYVCIYVCMYVCMYVYYRASLMAQTVKNLGAVQETQV